MPKVNGVSWIDKTFPAHSPQSLLENLRMTSGHPLLDSRFAVYRWWSPIILATVSAYPSALAGASGDIEQFTVSRDDTHHEAWPYLCIASNGDLVCSYAEADVHGGGALPRTMVRISKDQGCTWSNPVVIDSLRSPTGRNFMMCRWTLRLNDGSLLLASDFTGCGPLAPPGTPHNWSNDPANCGDAGAWLYRSLDNGRTWKGPQKTYCLTVSLTMKQLSNGTILLGGSHYHCKGDYWSQVIYYSKDNAKTWYGPVPVLDDPEHSCAEGDIVEMSGGELIMYLRSEIPNAAGSYKMISADNGMTWQGPYAAGKYRIVGRVSAGILSSGEILVMHRVDEPANKGEAFGFFIETPEAALSRTAYDAKDFKPTAKRWGIIDTDSSTHPDVGYGGWVQLPDDDIYAVQYITADAPVGKPFIRGYRIRQSFLTKGSEQH